MGLSVDAITALGSFLNCKTCVCSNRYLIPACFYCKFLSFMAHISSYQIISDLFLYMISLPLASSQKIRIFFPHTIELFLLQNFLKYIPQYILHLFEIKENRYSSQPPHQSLSQYKPPQASAHRRRSQCLHPVRLSTAVHST